MCFYSNMIELIFELFIEAIWPITTLLIFFALKDSLSSFISNIKLVKYKDATIESGINDEQSSKSSKEGVGNIVGKQKNESYSDYVKKYSSETQNILDEIIHKETNIEEGQDKDNQIELLKNYSKTLILLKAFERMYFEIYGSQIYLLDHLNSSSYETKTSLKYFYDKAKNQYPEVYKTYSYDNWLNYISNNGFIDINQNEEVILLPFGKDFLHYLIEAGLTFNKHY